MGRNLDAQHQTVEKGTMSFGLWKRIKRLTHLDNENLDHRTIEEGTIVQPIEQIEQSCLRFP